MNQPAPELRALRDSLVEYVMTGREGDATDLAIVIDKLIAARIILVQKLFCEELERTAIDKKASP